MGIGLPRGTAAGDAAGGLPLLTTKLFVPRPRPDLVPRPRLLARLDAGLDTGRCSLLSASAGTGKTSLVAAWLARLDRPVAWLTLDERDQDAGQVLRYLVAAWQTIAPACGRRASAWLDAPRLPPPEVVVTELVNDLAALPEPNVLVLDDYHLVRAPAMHDAVAFLLEHLPPPLHLVIASREDPPLPLPRLRARRQLVEVRAADLSFSVEEAATLLASGMGLRLAEAQVTVLVERTEGWAAGLQLAGLALRDRPDPATFVTAFTGGHRLVADYLMAEVLERLPARQAPHRPPAATARQSWRSWSGPTCSWCRWTTSGCGTAITTCWPTPSAPACPARPAPRRRPPSTGGRAAGSAGKGCCPRRSAMRWPARPPRTRRPGSRR